MPALRVPMVLMDSVQQPVAALDAPAPAPRYVGDGLTHVEGRTPAAPTPEPAPPVSPDRVQGLVEGFIHRHEQQRASESDYQRRLREGRNYAK